MEAKTNIYHVNNLKSNYKSFSNSNFNAKKITIGHISYSKQHFVPSTPHTNFILNKNMPHYNCFHVNCFFSSFS